MDTVPVAPAWLGWAGPMVGAFLLWLVRGYVRDVKELRETHMPRSEVLDALKTQEQHFAQLISNHQTDSAANFRELRQRLDSLNDTMLKVALK